MVVAYFLMHEITTHGGFVGSGLDMSTTVGGIVGLTWTAGRIYANSALRLGRACVSGTPFVGKPGLDTAQVDGSATQT